MPDAIAPQRAEFLRGALALIVLVALVFAQTWSFEFVSWDDQMYVTGNPKVLAGLSYEGVRWAFETRHTGLFTPLAWISHMADVSLWGRHAGGHHLSSVLLHTLSTLLLFALLVQTTGETWRSFLVGALFAIHPLHVESVAWVAERKDVLVAFFYLATLYCHAMWVRDSKLSWRAMTYLMAILAGMSKPMAVTLPVAMVLIDFWPLRRFDFSSQPRQALIAAVKEKWVFFLGAIALTLQTLSFGQDPNLAPVNYQWLDLPERLQVAGAAYGVYLWKTVWPAALSFFYPYRPPLPIWEYLLPPLVLFGLLLVAWRRRSSFPALWFGIAWYCVTLLPVSGIVQIAWYAYADRYSYLPLIGIFASLVWAVPFSAAADASRRTALAARLVAAVLLVAAAIAAYLQVGTWKDSQSLYSQAIGSDPANRMARLALAQQYVAKQQFDLATVHLDILLQRPMNDPLTAQGLLLRGDVFKFQGQGEQARTAWEAAAAADRTYWRARLRLGTEALEQGDAASAIANFLAADQLLHNNDEILNNLGVAYARAGALRQALQAYDRAVRANWLNQTARLNLALSYEKMGASAQAREQYSALLTLNPQNAGASEGLARLGGKERP
jgi:tetratricopeptide (TPR) repeat protein